MIKINENIKDDNVRKVISELRKFERCYFEFDPVSGENMTSNKLYMSDYYRIERCIELLQHYDDLLTIIRSKSENEVQDVDSSGHWINEILALPLSDGYKECVKCSKCGLHYDNPSNYCPNCGEKKKQKARDKE